MCLFIIYLLLFSGSSVPAVASNSDGDKSCIDLVGLLDESMDVDKVIVIDDDVVDASVDSTTVEITPIAPSVPGHYLYLLT